MPRPLVVLPPQAVCFTPVCPSVPAIWPSTYNFIFGSVIVQWHFYHSWPRVRDAVVRDRPNSRRKMRDFTGCF